MFLLSQIFDTSIMYHVYRITFKQEPCKLDWPFKFLSKVESILCLLVGASLFVTVVIPFYCQININKFISLLLVYYLHMMNDVKKDARHFCRIACIAEQQYRSFLPPINEDAQNGLCHCAKLIQPSWREVEWRCPSIFSFVVFILASTCIFSVSKRQIEMNANM